MSAITVSNLGKAYKQYNSRWARFAEWVFPFLGERHQLKWVLKGLSFSVRPGEALGIIGINGAGKSTLLKMITGTVQLTEGKVLITGKVAALLELGMGFHPDFTGRQNVYMAGQLLGYSSGEIASLMPEIEAFAEIGSYIDQPVRVYSSGMQMRLAFSVATVRRPDVLIVDEALSVGDAHFQHKSFEKIREFRRQGTTLLIVSHDKMAIQSICDQAILLNAGRLEMEGSPEAVLDFYNAMISNDSNITIQRNTGTDGVVQTISGSREATINSVSLLNKSDIPVEIIEVGQEVGLKIGFSVNCDIKDLTIGFVIKNRYGQEIFGTNTNNLKTKIAANTTSSNFGVFSFFADLGVGSYSISIALHSGNSHIEKNYEWKDRAIVFSVVNNSHPQFVGSSWIPVTWKQYEE